MSMPGQQEPQQPANVVLFRSVPQDPPKDEECTRSVTYDVEPDDRTDDDIANGLLCNAVASAELVTQDLPSRVWSLVTFAEAEGNEEGAGTVSAVFWTPGILSIVSDFGSLALRDHHHLKTPETAARFILRADDIEILGCSDAPFGPDVQATVRVLLAEADEAIACSRRCDGETVYRTLSYLASWDDLHDASVDAMVETPAGRARLRAFIKESAVFWGPAHLFETSLLETEDQMCAGWTHDWSVTLAVARRWAERLTAAPLS